VMTMLALALFAFAVGQNGSSFWDHFLTVADVGVGRLSLILLDINGDGREEIFLAPSGTCGNGGCAWYVYSRTESPNHVQYLGEVDVPPAVYRLDRASRTLTSCWRMSGTECALVEHRVQNGALSRRTIGSCRSKDDACGVELTRIARWQRDEAPPVLSAAVPASIDLTSLEWSESQSASAVRATAVPDFKTLRIVSAPK
jgi:hypothetical protein